MAADKNTNKTCSFFCRSLHLVLKGKVMILLLSNAYRHDKKYKKITSIPLILSLHHTPYMIQSSQKLIKKKIFVERF